MAAELDVIAGGKLHLLLPAALAATQAYGAMVVMPTWPCDFKGRRKKKGACDAHGSTDGQELPHFRVLIRDV